MGGKMNNFFKAKTIVALDISLNGLRIMEVDNNRKDTVVLAYGSIELYQDKIEHSLENEDNYLEKKLAELVNKNVKGKIKGKYAAISIPASKTFMRTIKMPISVQKDLANAVDLEIEQYVPMPKEFLEIDYEVVSKTKKEIEISMVAAPKVIINRAIDIARSIGLEPILIEPSIESIARILIKSEQGHLNTLIMDIGLTNVDLGILNQEIRATSSVEIGGNDFTLAIKDALNISSEKAYQLKVLKGFNKSSRQEKISKALTPLMDKIEREIKKTIRYNDERLQGKPIEQVIITGPGSNLAGIGEYFTNKLMIPVRIANPWQNVRFRKINPPKRITVSRYLTVSGLSNIKAKEIVNG